MTEWWIAPQTVGAVLLFQQNAYNFPAALLQAPKFDPAASDAANYGAIGAIVGHEVSHFVDTLGAEYDADGAARHWWTAADLAGYRPATAPLVEQFSAYRPFPDLAVDGTQTLVGEPRRSGRPHRRLRRLSPFARRARRTTRLSCGGSTANSSSASPGAGGARSTGSAAQTGRQQRSSRTRSPTASPRCATSTPGTRRSTCSPAIGSIFHPRAGSASGRR